MPKPTYLNYIHHFRGLAIVFIVGIHCMNSYGWKGHETENRVIELLIDNSTVLFVFISGFLFQYLNTRDFKFQVYFKKKMRFVMLPYLIISIPALINNLFYESGQVWMPEVVGSNWFLQLIFMIITGKHLGPLWFMPMIFVFYLLSPVFVAINRSKFYYFALPVLLLFTVFTHRFGYFSNNFDSIVYFIPIYIFGMATSHFKETLFNYSLKILTPILIVYFLLNYLQFTELIATPTLGGFDKVDVYAYFTFNPQKLKMILLCIIFLLIFNRVNHLKFPILKFLGDYSFGLYFVHMYVIIALSYAIQAVYNDFNLSTLSYLLFLSLVTLLSLLPVHIIKKLAKDKSRLIIGS